MRRRRSTTPLKEYYYDNHTMILLSDVEVPRTKKFSRNKKRKPLFFLERLPALARGWDANN